MLLSLLQSILLSKTAQIFYIYFIFRFKDHSPSKDRLSSSTIKGRCTHSRYISQMRFASQIKTRDEQAIIHNFSVIFRQCRKNILKNCLDLSWICHGFNETDQLLKHFGSQEIGNFLTRAFKISEQIVNK